MGPGSHLGGWVLTPPQRSARSRVTHTDIWNHGRGQNRKGGGRLLGLLVVAGVLVVPATVLVVPATASAAATATLVGDDGQPAPLDAAAPPTIRNMSTKVEVQNVAPAG